MSRSVLILTVIAAVTLAGSCVASAKSGSKQEIAELKSRVEALEKQIASLQTQLEQLSARAGATGPNPLENEAKSALNEINGLIASAQFDTAKTKMAEFMRKYGRTQAARQARSLNQELSVIGKDAPTDWGIERWFQGESEVALTSDKTTLVVFWEVWCGYCKREVPKMQNLYTSLKDDGLQVVGLTRITKSSTPEKVQDFITEKKVGYAIAKENGETARYFNVSGIPAAAVVKGGKVVWRGHPAKLSPQLLKSWL